MPRPANPEVRARLLSVGRQVVHDQGFNGCGVQDITAAAGIPKGSFYNYFDSKESFASEILKEYWQSIEDRHGPRLYDARVKPLARIVKFFQGLCEDHGEHDFTLGCLIGNLSLELSKGSIDARKSLSDLLLRWQGALADCLREAQVRHELADDRDADELAAILIEAWEGAVMRSKVDQNDNACRRFETVVLPRLIG
ncbi:TetR/AcrR family transcriptional regulator [Burkholderia sp. L27(2015)]|uniref:TetR/AcrR family transcriptional regulator n=1 Tax=Burkholderia sp. L27(2015) TaxID=1641858 RepID=UPI00131BA3DB|nr:TetR/AcrR family transcriptional regulator [Burkholderia sp. L27(2015)]